MVQVSGNVAFGECVECENPLVVLNQSVAQGTEACEHSVSGVANEPRGEDWFDCLGSHWEHIACRGIGFACTKDDGKQFDCNHTNHSH